MPSTTRATPQRVAPIATIRTSSVSSGAGSGLRATGPIARGYRRDTSLRRPRIAGSGTLSRMTTVDTAQRPTPDQAPTGGLDRFFRISERGSSVQREVRGGFATFFTI